MLIYRKVKREKSQKLQVMGV